MKKPKLTTIPISINGKQAALLRDLATFCGVRVEMILRVLLAVEMMKLRALEGMPQDMVEALRGFVKSGSANGNEAMRRRCLAFLDTLARRE